MNVVKRFCFVFLLLGVLAVKLVANASAVSEGERLQKLFEERIKCAAVVEYFVQYEIDRESKQIFGTVVDNDGLVIVLPDAIPDWVLPTQLKNFKVKPVGTEEIEFDATYLGQGFPSGMHFLRIEKKGCSAFKSVSEFSVGIPKVGELLWGISIGDKEYGYFPAFVSGRMSAVRPTPWDFGLMQQELGRPGAPVFNKEGAFVGIVSEPTPVERVFVVGSDIFRAELIDKRNGRQFLIAKQLWPYLTTPPKSPYGDPLPWLGVIGLKTLDPDVAEFMGLENQGAVVVADVLKGSPADKAGIKSRDVITSINGEPIPKFQPRVVTTRFVELEILKNKIGDTVTFGIRREGRNGKAKVKLGKSLKTMNQAEREYFPRIGVSVREFIVADGVSKRELDPKAYKGVVVDFVKPNGPVAEEGILAGDWLQKIDGKEIETYQDAIHALRKIEKDESKRDFVMLIQRDNETQVVPIKLK